MKRKRILTQYLLYFLMLMLLLAAGCSSSSDDNTTTTTVDYWVTVSGTVATAGGTPVSGVVMSAMVNLEVMNIDLLNISYGSDQFGTVITGTDGTYSLTVPAALFENYTLVLTPAKNAYAFTPANRVLTIAKVDQTGVNFTAAVLDEFSQNDLTGYWRVKTLRSGTENGWVRARISVAATTGIATCLSYETSDAPGVTTCPADFELTLTMGSGDNEGVITQSGTYAAGTNHMTMNSDKDLMAGTGTAGTNYQLVIAQKDPIPVTTATTTQYIGSELNSKNFVFHSLRVGTTVNEWRYGAGATSTTAVTTISSESTPTAPNGTAPTTLDGITLAVGVNGVVTISSASTQDNFEGFLSIDERTIVATFTDASGDPEMIVIQLTDNQTINTMTGSSINHMLAAANGLTPVWAYHDINISRLDVTLLPEILELSLGVNVMLNYNWELSLNYTALQKLGLIKLRTLNIADSGAATVTVADDTLVPADTGTERDVIFHGQLAFDGTFMVGVETLTLTEGTFYALDVITH